MNLIKLAFVIIISIHLGAPTFAQSCVDRGYDNDYTPMFGGKTYCTKEETGSYEKKTPKLSHDTNPPGIDTYDKRKYIYDLSIDVNANYDANMDGGTNIEWEKQYYSDLPGNKLSMMVYKEKSSSHRERTLFGDLQGADVDGGFNFIENKISTDANNKQTLRSFNDGKITYKWDNYIGSASVFATMDYNAYGHYPSDPERPVRYIIRIDHSIETKKIGDANNLTKNFEAKISRYSGWQDDQGMLLDQIGTMIVEDGIIKIRDMDGNYLTAE